MTQEELRKISVQDVLDSEDYRNRLAVVLSRKAFRTKEEAQMVKRLRERRLCDVETFIPVLCSIMNKECSLPSNMRWYIYHIGVKVLKDCVDELKKQVTDEGKPETSDEQV